MQEGAHALLLRKQLEYAGQSVFLRMASGYCTGLLKQSPQADYRNDDM